MQLHQSLAQILKPIVQQMEVTSAWVCQLEDSLTIVVGQYMADTANLLEKDGDLHATHNEGSYASLGAWIKGEIHPLRILQVDTLPRNDPEYRELSVNHVKTVLNVAVEVDGKFWGYIEFWDTRRTHEFTPSQINAAEAASLQIASLIRQSK